MYYEERPTDPPVIVSITRPEFDHAIFAWGCQRRIILAKDAKKSTKFKEVINVITDVSYPGQAKAISYGGKGAIGIRKWLDGAC